MSFLRFISHLSLLSLAIVSLALLGLAGHRLDLFYVIVASCLLYIQFSVGIYIYAERTSRSVSKYTFNGVISASFIVKLIMSILFLAAWARLYPSGDNYHVILYIFVYVAYTIYEVYFLSILAKRTSLD